MALAEEAGGEGFDGGDLLSLLFFGTLGAVVIFALWRDRRRRPGAGEPPDKAA